MTTKITTRFKVQGVGLDTTTTRMKLWTDEDDIEFDYIHTSISSNNDYLISDYVKKSIGSSLITSIDFINNPDRALLGHLLELGRKKIDLLLVETSSILKNLEVVKETVESLKSSGIIGEFGIKNPGTLEEIKQIEDALKGNIKFISLDLCPLHFNYSIVQYCKDNNIDILGFNPFGGYISSSSIISSFTAPYLLAFSGTYSSVIFLSGRDLILSKESMKYIKDNIIGSECSSKFILKKNVSRLYKPIKKVVETSLIFNENLVLKTNWPEYLYPLDDIAINLGTPLNIVDHLNKRLRTELEMSVYDLLDITEFPEGISIQSKFAIIRYQVLSHLKIKFPDWEVAIINSGDLAVGIVLYRSVEKKKRGFLRKKSIIETESKHFLCALPSIDQPIFIEDPDMKNTDEEISNPNN